MSAGKCRAGEVSFDENLDRMSSYEPLIAGTGDEGLFFWLFNWEGTFEVLDDDYWRSTTLIFINHGLAKSGVDIRQFLVSWLPTAKPGVAPYPNPYRPPYF